MKIRAQFEFKYLLNPSLTVDYINIRYDLFMPLIYAKDSKELVIKFINVVITVQ